MQGGHSAGGHNAEGSQCWGVTVLGHL